MMSPEQASKNLEKMAETTITPDFLNWINIIGFFLLGFACGGFLYEFTIANILSFICGLGFVAVVWYTKKNYEWKKE